MASNRRRCRHRTGKTTTMTPVKWVGKKEMGRMKTKTAAFIVNLRACSFLVRGRRLHQWVLRCVRGWRKCC